MPADWGAIVGALLTSILSMAAVIVGLTTRAAVAELRAEIATLLREGDRQAEDKFLTRREAGDIRHGISDLSKRLNLMERKT